MVRNLNLECKLQIVLAASKQFKLLESHSVEVGLGSEGSPNVPCRDWLAIILFQVLGGTIRRQKADPWAT